MAASIQDVGPTIVYTPGPDHRHLVEYENLSVHLGLHQIRFTDRSQHASIIIVHGLFGHPKNTWTARTPRNTQNQIIVDQSTDRPRKKLKIGPQELFDEIFWPRDLLPTEIPTARIITWGYDVRIESLLTETSKATVFQHAETLLVDLALLRQSPMAHPIIFVAHSLGGIVVKDALSLARQETTHLKENLPATIGVAFLGTPHRGSKTASLGKIAFELSRLLLQNPNIKILRALEGQSEILDRISKSFTQILASKEDIKVHSFQEELETKGMPIVDASSSTIGSGRETRSSLYANHRNMAKYASAEDINFQRVSSILRRWVEPLSAPPPTSSNQIPAPYNDLDKGPTDISDEEYERLLAALNFPEARSRLENVEEAYTDTYTWIYEDRLGFKAWLQGHDPRPIFWISGKPGSGKSTLMKYALKAAATGRYLREFGQTKWIVTSYFFHDRGSEVQKTMEGFLCEILFQMLERRRDLVPPVYPILRNRNAQKELLEPAFCEVEKLRRALFAIACNSDSPINCCIFVDALDEHLGTHRDLTSFLNDLAHLNQDWIPNFRLRFCVASRPENHFLDALYGYPGFAVHEYTRADIRRYAAGRFQDEHAFTLDKQQKEITLGLVTQIEAKSDGVFMWVRLVVDELVEGLCEGDTLGELEALLSNIPTELSDLYMRAIARHPRRATTSIGKHRNEAYVMFRIASSAVKPIPLRHLMMATLLLAGEQHSVAEVDEMSRESTQRRLNSRSCGLLEVATDLTLTESDSDEGSDGDRVQFIHQTVKEFMISHEGAAAIKEGITLADEDGCSLIFRYILERLKTSCRWAAENFWDYSEIMDPSPQPVATWIHLSMESIPDSGLVFLIERGAFMEAFPEGQFWSRNNLLAIGKIVLCMIIYSLCNMPSLLQLCIRMYPAVMDAKLLVALLEAGTRGFYLGCFPILLEAGVASHLPADSFHGIDDLVKERLGNPR